MVSNGKGYWDYGDGGDDDKHGLFVVHNNDRQGSGQSETETHLCATGTRLNLSIRKYCLVPVYRNFRGRTKESERRKSN